VKAAPGGWNLWMSCERDRSAHYHARAEQDADAGVAIAGVVTARTSCKGAPEPWEAPYEITDLGEVWAMADAYESDLSRIRRHEGVADLARLSHRTFSGSWRSSIRCSMPRPAP